MNVVFLFSILRKSISSHRGWPGLVGLRDSAETLSKSGRKGSLSVKSDGVFLASVAHVPSNS